MRIPSILLFVFACASSVAMAGAAAPPGVAPVWGVVADAVTGKPVAGAMVGVYQSGRGTVKTDRLGRFKLLAAPGEKRIIYYDGGNRLYRSDGTTYTMVDVPAKGISGVSLELFRFRPGHGKVVDPSGKPLAGATVIVCGSEFVRTVTDSKGRFKLVVPSDQQAPGG